MLHWIELSASALRHNARQFRSILRPTTKIMAMVKANAYGHGLNQLAPTLAPFIDWFGVNTLAEALTLRRLHLTQPILITCPIHQSEFATAVRHHISLCVHSLHYLTSLTSIPAKVHLKINTGMNRLGLSLGELPSALQLLATSRHTVKGVYTHFHSADSPGSATQQQLALFKSAVSQVKSQFPKVIAHCANTSATLNLPGSHLDMVRLGLGLYGLWPSSYLRHKFSSRITLRPVLSWKANIIQTRVVLPPDTIGYGASFSPNRAVNTAILPVGYSDGLDIRLANQPPFLGRIAMNFCCVRIPIQAPADSYEIIGPRHPVDLLAKQVGTINYQVLAGLSPLIPRRIVK